MRSLVLIAFVMACGGNGSDEGPGIFDGPDAGVMVDAPPPPMMTTDPALEGTWRWDGCASTETKTQYQIRFAGNLVEWIDEHHRSADTTCASPYAVRRVVQSYTLRGPSPFTEGANKIDLRYSGITLMTTEQSIVDMWNQAHYCGRNDWVVSVAREVTGKTCGNSSTYPAVGDVLYDIYRVDATKLFFGDTASGTGETAALRPTQLDPGHYYR